MMSSPVPSFVICLAYIVFVKMGPWLMRDRKPFDIRNILLFYNFAMVLLSTYCFVEVRENLAQARNDSAGILSNPMLHKICQYKLLFRYVINRIYWYCTKDPPPPSKKLGQQIKISTVEFISVLHTVKFP